MDFKSNIFFKTIRNLRVLLCPELECKQHLHDWLHAAELSRACAGVNPVGVLASAPKSITSCECLCVNFPGHDRQLSPLP